MKKLLLVAALAGLLVPQAEAQVVCTLNETLGCFSGGGGIAAGDNTAFTGNNTFSGTSDFSGLATFTATPTAASFFSQLLIEQESAPAAPSAALAGAGAGNVDDGTHLYAYTCVDDVGETTIGTASAEFTMVDKSADGQVDLTSIAVCVSDQTASRKVYRTTAGTTTPFKLLTTIADNSTTTHTDNTADAGLGANSPASNTTAVRLSFEGTADAFESRFTVLDPTADRWITLPDASVSLAGADLANLASVALNTALLPDAAAADDIGSATLPFKEIYLAGTSGTPGTNNFKITGASTSGTRTITLGDADGTVCVKETDCGFTAVQTFAHSSGATISGGNANLLFSGTPTNFREGIYWSATNHYVNVTDHMTPGMQLNLLLGATSRSLGISEAADLGYDWNNGPCGTSACTDPTLIVHSANQATDEWISLEHNQTDGEIDVGSGDIKLMDPVTFEPDVDTIADSGDGNPATATLDPTGSVVLITCSDANSCDVTMGETGATSGQIAKIVCMTASPATCDFADTANVSELAGAFAMDQYDALSLVYASDRWVEVSRSVN